MNLTEQVMNGGAILSNGIVVRKAVIPDYYGIEKLVDAHRFRRVNGGKQGVLIPLSPKEISEIILDGAFYVADAAGPFEDHQEAYRVPRSIVACGGFIEYDRIAEVRSFVTDPQHRGNGLQTMILNAVLETARQKGHNRVYTLSNPDAVNFFKKHGFEDSDIPFAKHSKIGRAS
ncbi:MAG: GNAT family N-acetyltransferase, partial [Nanoarchaeota archaeon]